MKCRYCGFENNDAAVYCAHCANKLEEPEAKPVSRLRVAGIIAAALLSVAVILFGLQLAGVPVFSGGSAWQDTDAIFSTVAESNYLEIDNGSGGILIYGKAGDARWKVICTGISEEDVINAISAKDALGQNITLSIEYSGSSAIASILEDNLQPGMPYTVSLGNGLTFADSALSAFREITFILRRGEIQNVEFRDNVIELNADDVSLTGSNTLRLTDGRTIEEGDILIVTSQDENGFAEKTAYKVETVSEDGSVTTGEPALDEIFSELDISATYETDPDSFVLDAEAIEKQVRESSFFDCLIRTAYAGQSNSDKVSISIKTLPGTDDRFNIRITFKLKDAYKSGDQYVDIVFVMDIGYKAQINIDMVSCAVMNVSCESMSVVDFSVGLADEAHSDPYNYDFKAQDFIDTLQGQLQNTDEDTIRLGIFPVATGGLVNATVEIEAFMNWSLMGDIDLGSGLAYCCKAGAIVSPENCITYFTDGYSLDINRAVGIIKLEQKAGIRASLLASLLKVASAGFEYDVGEYAEIAGAFDFLGGSDSTFTDNCYGYAEYGLYCELSLVAKLNLGDRIKWEKDIIDEKWPLKQFGKRENVDSLRATQDVIYIDKAGKAQLPAIYATYYDVFENTFEERIVAYDNLTYACSESMAYTVQNDGRIEFNGNLPYQFTFTISHKENERVGVTITLINPAAEITSEPSADEPVYEEPSTPITQPGESPSEVAKRCFEAILSGDTETALACMTSEANHESQEPLAYYSDLLTAIESLNDQLSELTGYNPSPPVFIVTATNEQISGDTATVDIQIAVSYTDSNYTYTYPYTYQVTCEIEDGQWRVAESDVSYEYS